MRKYIQLLIMVFGLSACESFLDVKPEGEVLSDVLFETSEGCEDALYGVYANLGQLELYGEVLSYELPDLLASYYTKEKDYSQKIGYLLTYNYTGQGADRTPFDNIWTKMYENISYANSILYNLKGKEGRFRYYDFYKGEALALRAFMHFELCCAFAPAYREETVATPAIPYCETYEPLVYPFRTVGDIYRKVIKDLKDAEVLLKDEEKYMNSLQGHALRENTPGVSAFMTERQFHLNLYAVQGLLARVYWMKNDMDSAVIYAKKVIGSEKFALTEKIYLQDEYASRISINETLWGVRGQGKWAEKLDESFNNPSNEPRMLLLPFNGYYIYEGMYDEGMFPQSWGFEQLFQVEEYQGEQDFRMNWFRLYDSGENSRYRHFYKIYDQKGKLEGKKGVNMIRLPEMYLIMAEGLLKKDQVAEARRYFDKYTESRGFIWRDEVKNPFNMDLINKEYRKELMGEGRMWFNMKRQNMTLNSCMNYGMTFPGSDEVYVWPIPEDEFEFREGGKEGVYNPEAENEEKTN